MSLEALKRLRRGYAEVRAALPWLDACWCPDEAPAFVTGGGERWWEFAHRARSDGGEVRLRAEAGAPAPFVVKHTDLPPSEAAALASRQPEAPVILESGPVKLLYCIDELLDLLPRVPNLYLCTYNLCNWRGLERLVAAGAGRQLLLGTHGPAFDADAAMALVALGDLGWETKCDIAGNNLRRLLERSEVLSAEVVLPGVPAFLVDAHAHSGRVERFTTPDLGYGPEGWLEQMDALAVETLLVCPMESLEGGAPAAEATARLREAAGGRVRFLEVFDPRRESGSEVARVREALLDPQCAGVKMHPSFHGIPADDASYAPIFALCEETERALLTHSWEDSPTNAAQVLSHPDRFRRHLLEHPGTKLVLGHAGGRPGAFVATVALCREFGEVCVDLAGDYFDAGLVEALVAEVGAERVLFGSDVNWIDPRCVLGPVLGSMLDDEVVLKVLRGNARRVYWVG